MDFSSRALKVEGPLCHCHYIEELLQTVDEVHFAHERKLLIDSSKSKHSLEAISYFVYTLHLRVYIVEQAIYLYSLRRVI